MKRFWKTTAVTPEASLYTVRLDHRPVKLPSGAALAIPYAGLAQEIAAEWDRAGDNFTPEDLPLTRLASTALERVGPHRASIIGQLAAYGLNDLICYRAPSPETLIARQRAHWDPWLDWANTAHGLRLLTTTGMMPVNQPPATRDQLTALLEAHTDYALAALGVIIPALGSFVLGLAVAANALAPDAACDLALLDELWQAEHWGEDQEARAHRHRLREDIVTSARFLELCAP